MRPPPRFAVYAYPWALAEIGVERALDELAAVGVDGLQLALSYHVASFLTPRGPRRRVLGGDMGSVWFDYEAASPGAWPVRPKVLREAADAAPEVLRGAADLGMQVVAWLVYLYNHDLAGRYQDLAVRNAFGDVHPAQLCPSQPAVRDYALRLTSAALALGATGTLTGLHAESLSFLPWLYGLMTLKSSVEVKPPVGRLLSLCFCDACRERAQAAGLGPDAVAAAVRAAVDDGLSPGFGRESGVPADVSEYAGVLAESTAELNREAARVASSGGLRFSSTAAEPAAERADEGAVELTRPLVDEVRVKVQPGATADELAAQRDAALAGCRSGTHVFAQYQLREFADSGSLLAAVSAAREAGIAHHRFYEYSVLTEEHLRWLAECRQVVE